MMWDLPIAVEINGKQHPIRNKCDYRVVLDVICALNDNELTDEEKLITSNVNTDILNLQDYLKVQRRIFEAA